MLYFKRMEQKKVKYINVDNLHYSFRAIRGYQKPINIILSAREPGKTSSFWREIAYKQYYERGMKGILMVRQTVEISVQLIDDIENEINKFLSPSDQIKFEYKESSFTSGIVDVSINGDLFFRIVSLSIKMVRLKKMKVPKCGWIVQDEFIIDPRTKEKYLTNEMMRIKELYTTNIRTRFSEDEPIYQYYLGNPYSLFNPLFVDLGVDTSKLKIGEKYVGKGFVIDFYKMKPELREHILKINPFYQFDEDYKAYALEGKAINDTNLKVSNVMPSGYVLKFICRFEGIYIGIFMSKELFYEDYYYAREIPKNYGSNKASYAFDFKELVNGTTLFNSIDRSQFTLFKRAIEKRKITYETITIAYYIQEIYNYL